MLNTHFDGCREIGKPTDMTDEQCSGVYALHNVEHGYPGFTMAYQPSKEDLEAFLAGRPLFIRILTGGQLPPHALWTNDANGVGNF